MIENKKLVCTVYDSIKQIPKEHFHYFDRKYSITMTGKFWQTIENSKLKDIDCRYMLFFSNGKPVAFVPCCIIRTDIAIFSSGLLKSILNRIRIIFPNFFTIKTLECGSPVTINTPQFIKKESLDKKVFLSALKKELSKLCINKKCRLMIIRDFETGHDIEEYRLVLKELGFSWLPSMPNTYLDIKWRSMDEYYGSMRSHYKYKLQKYLTTNKENNMTHQLIDDFSDQSVELCRQWHVVHDNAKELAREVLTPDFYAAMSKNLGEDSKVLLFYSDEVLVAHALLLKDGELLRWLYVGRNRSQRDAQYFYMIHAIIETAMSMGVGKIEMGLTTYPIKQDFGATLAPIHVAIRIAPSFLNPFLACIYNLLHDSRSYPTKRVFK